MEETKIFIIRKKTVGGTHVPSRHGPLALQLIRFQLFDIHLLLFCLDYILTVILTSLNGVAASVSVGKSQAKHEGDRELPTEEDKTPSPSPNTMEEVIWLDIFVALCQKVYT